MRNNTSIGNKESFFAKLKSDFKYDVNRLGFTMISEGGPIDGFLE